LAKRRNNGAVQPARKLYLNPEVAQVALQLLGVLKVNGVEAELSRTLQVQGAIIYKDAFLGVSLRNFQRDAKNGGFRLAGMDVAGAEEDQKVFAQVKRFDSILIEFERLVLMAPTKYFPAAVTASRTSREPGSARDCANINAVNSSRVNERGR